MPKESANVFNARMVKEYPKILKMDSSVLLCVLCNCTINGNKVYNVHQHFKTSKHNQAMEKNSSAPKQSFLKNFTSDLNTYHLDLCRTFLNANIPLHKISDPGVRSFLEKYHKNSLPSESTLRTKYVPTIYESYLKELQAKAQSKKIWVSMDETTDSEQRMVANFVFGLLEENGEGKSYLLNMAHIERSNASTMAAFFTDSLHILWPNG